MPGVHADTSSPQEHEEGVIANTSEVLGSDGPEQDDLNRVSAEDEVGMEHSPAADGDAGGPAVIEKEGM
jgi:hypothetical protein